MKTSEVATVVSQQQIENVPQMTRNFLEFADTVPGVVFEVDAKGKTSIRGGAQNQNGVNLYIDGVGQKGYVRSGISGQAGDTQGNPFPQLAIGEYKVITSNYKAEYDQISSAAITAITKSGTNQFEGDAFGTYTADNWRAKTPAEQDAGTKTRVGVEGIRLLLRRADHRGQAALLLHLRGQALRDSGHGDTRSPAAARHRRPTARQRPGPARTREHRLQGRLVLRQVRLGAERRRSLRPVGKFRREDSQGDQAGTGTAASAAIDTTNNEDRYELSWKHNGDGWLNEVQATYENAPYLPHLPHSDVNGAEYTFKDNNAADQVILSVDGADPRAAQNKSAEGLGFGQSSPSPTSAGSPAITLSRPA